MPTHSFSAVLIGATGLVGSQLLRQLLDHERCREVTVLGRRATGLQHAKLRDHVIDFDRPETWAERVRGDVLFSALGTTLKQAGSKEAQFRVDYTYQYVTAQAAARNGVSTYVLVSSAGANPKAKIFYSRIKGELERDTQALGFRRCVVLQPGLLAGHREQKRTGEELAYAIAKRLPAWRALDAVRPYPAETVARAGIQAALDGAAGVRTLKLGEIFGAAAAE